MRQELDNRFKLYLYAAWLAAVLLCLITLHVPFFSDQETLISYPAFLFANSASEGSTWMTALPTNIDTGHPPLIQLYMGMVWFLFGSTLPVAHLAALPFLLILITQYYRLAGRLLTGKWVGIALILLFAQPTFLAHAVTVSTEIFLLAFALLTINAMLIKNRFLFFVGASLLLLCSLRGLVVIAALGLYEMSTLRPFKWRQFLLLSGRFLLTLIPFIGWNIYHYATTGWILSHEGSPWVEHRQLTSITSLFPSIVILVWRFIEFGMILIWIPVVYAWYRHRFKSEQVFNILLFLIAMLALALLPFENPITNRYLLLPAILLCLLALKEISAWKFGQLYAIFCTLGLLSAHLYVYPEVWNKRIGYAFDATLVYLPYSMHLRPEMEEFLEHHQDIQHEDVVWSGFPEYHPYTWTDPSWTDTRIEQHQIDTLQIEKADFILLSNMMNEIPYGTVLRIRQEWDPIVRFERGQIFMELYRNPKAVKNG